MLEEALKAEDCVEDRSRIKSGKDKESEMEEDGEVLIEAMPYSQECNTNKEDEESDLESGGEKTVF